MTRAEKAQIGKAIDLIHRQDNYEGGMAILCKLAGIPNEPIKSVPCSPAELADWYTRRRRKRR